MYENLMSVKHIVIIFLCAPLNLSAATTQETQTDPIAGIHTLPTVQPISFSGAVISQALKAVQIREQALRTAILTEEEKGVSILLKNRFCILWNQKMIDLRKSEEQLGVDGAIALVHIRNDVQISSQTISLFSRNSNEYVRTDYSKEDDFGMYNFTVWYAKAPDSENIILRNGCGCIAYLVASSFGKPFFGRSMLMPRELCFQLNLSYYGNMPMVLEPAEGEYHVDPQGRMMPVFTLVAEKKQKKK